MPLPQVKPEDAPEPEPDPGLDEKSKREIGKLFKMYDKDKSGTLSIKEIEQAFVRFLALRSALRARRLCHSQRHAITPVFPVRVLMRHSCDATR
jgi:hypothetical protein